MKPRRIRPLADRVYPRLVEDENGCWTWTGAAHVEPVTRAVNNARGGRHHGSRKIA